MKDDRTSRSKRKKQNATFPVDSTTNTGYAIGAVPPVTGGAIAPPVTFVDDRDDGCWDSEPSAIVFED